MNSSAPTGSRLPSNQDERHEVHHFEQRPCFPSRRTDKARVELCSLRPSKNRRRFAIPGARNATLYVMTINLSLPPTAASLDFIATCQTSRSTGRAAIGWRYA
jgi:hypothetical protein